VLSRHAAVREYQVRQTGAGASVRVVVGASLASDDLVDELRSRLEAAGLPDPEVSVETVDRIERSAVGKRLSFISRPVEPR
jgi:hypothetical protein